LVLTFAHAERIQFGLSARVSWSVRRLGGLLREQLPWLFEYFIVKIAACQDGIDAMRKENIYNF
jgi:hypothetical protein